MVRLVLRNTFLTLAFEEGEDECQQEGEDECQQEPITRRCQLKQRRSRSLECDETRNRTLTDESPFHVERLNSLFTADFLSSDTRPSISGGAQCDTPRKLNEIPCLGSSPSISTEAASCAETEFGTDEASEAGDKWSKPLASFAKAYRHKMVPKSRDLEKEFREGKEREGKKESKPTTLMIRNIPNRYTQENLIADLEEAGFSGTFDFLYLPLDQGKKHRHHGLRKTSSNIGYAFVNFKDHESAEKCMDTFNGHTFSQISSNKIAAVSVAHMQGLRANLAHYQNAAVKAWS